MFDLPENLRSAVASLRVDCVPHARDAAGPVRLVLVDSDGKSLAMLRFTPDQARDAGPAIVRLLALGLARAEARRVADGLFRAAVRVWSVRN